MPPLTNIPTIAVSPVVNRTTAEYAQTVKAKSQSTILDLGASYPYRINSRVLRLLKEFRSLKDNWDEDGALAPLQKNIAKAEALVIFLDIIGQKVYHTAPGPNGEIMVDLRNNQKSVEIIFYHDRDQYVMFPMQSTPEQGEYSFEILRKILTWLNE